MIAVDFQCTKCRIIFEGYITEPDTDSVECSICGKAAERIISFRGRFRADPTWLPSALQLLQPDGERPIESRSEFDKYLKEHNIVQRC